MSWMFAGCTRLKEIKGLNNFNTKKVVDMTGMFSSCSEIESLELSSFDLSTVLNISCFTKGCEKLNEIKGIEKVIIFLENKLNELFE